MDPLAREVMQGWDRADSERGTWRNHWQQITELCLPERNDYTVEKAPGMKRNQSIFNETPEFALTQFANGLHSYLTSPYLPWFALHIENERIDAMREVRLWLDGVTQAMQNYYNGPRHNFASQSHEVYLDIGSIGTGVLAQLESDKSDILFSARHLKECVIWESDEDRIDALTRRWWFTAKQAFQLWGAAAGEKVLKAYEDGNNLKRFYFYHAVRPRKNRDPQMRDVRNAPFESIWVGAEDANVIQIGGYHEFPYHVPRFSKTVGEIYGRGPGMTMLPLMKMLNEATKLVIKAAQKVIDPPLQVPDDGFLLPIKTVPGSQNFYRASLPQQARIAPIQTGGRIDIGDEFIARLEQKLMRGFYVEYMMAPGAMNNPKPENAGKNVPAEFYLQQRDSNMRLLSPMLARMQSEFLGPLIDRTFAILWRKSERMGWGQGAPFPPPPEILSGRPFVVEYLSPIAIAQRSSELDSIGRLMQQQLLVRQINPQSPSVIDDQAVMWQTARDLNAPVAILKSPDRLAQEENAQAQQQQALMASQAADSLGSAIKNSAQGMQALQGPP